MHTMPSFPPKSSKRMTNSLADPLDALGAATALLAARGMACYVTDRDLIVRAAGGAPIPGAPTNPVGLPLADTAAEVAPHLGEVQEILSGRLAMLDLGLIRREHDAGTAFLWAQTLPRSVQGEILGVVYTVLDAATLGRQWERMERQRHELYEMRQRVAQLNMDLALAQSEVHRLDETKSQFVSAAAHELRNPLAALLGYIELIEIEDTSNLTPAQQQYMTGIDRSAQRLKSLTNNLLDISRLDSNRLELVMHTTDTLALVEQAVSEMQPLFDLKNQRVILKSEPYVPHVWADRVRAMQILTNLLSNAHKYTAPGGSVIVSVRRARNRPYVEIRIKDSGIGIPPEEQYRLFSRFYRASNAGRADGAGAGLGLAITHSLVRLHGGKIWFESAPGRGSTFFVTFPIASPTPDYKQP